jgi:hypothetical protein
LNCNCCSQFAYISSCYYSNYCISFCHTPHSWFLRKGRSTNWCPKYYHKHVFNMHAPDRVGPRVLEFLWLDTCSTIARHTMKS